MAASDPPLAPARGSRRDAGVKLALQRVMSAAQGVGRADLVEALRRQGSRLESEDFRVLVVGEFGRGKSALVNALVGAPVCGVSAQRATAVPTFIRYGRRPVARVVSVLADGDDQREKSRDVPLADAAHLTLQTQERELDAYSGVEIELPRRLLQDGLILVDTAGLGGGFAASGAATTLRALSAADALLLVTDASAELAASELEFFQAALSLCPVAACVITKTDLYPHWRRIAELDRRHLAGAGLALPVLPVSSVLHELAIDTSDSSLSAESGFDVLTKMLTDEFRRGHRSARCRAAVGEAHAALQMVLAQLEAEQRALIDPDGRVSQLSELQAAEQHAARMIGASSRWQEVLADELRTLRREVPRDLTDRFRSVQRDAQIRIAEATADREWSEFHSWLLRRVNYTSLAHHHLVLKRVQAATSLIAAQFEIALDQLPFAVPLQPSTPSDAAPIVPQSGRGSRIETALVAARGFTLGGSVLGGLLSVAHLSALALGGAALAVSAPVVVSAAAAAGVVAGATYTARMVWSTRQSQLRAAQIEVERRVGSYLDEALNSARRLDDDLLDLAFVNLREHFKELSERMLKSARAAVSAASEAAHLDDQTATVRRGQLSARLDEANALHETLSAALAATSGART